MFVTWNSSAIVKSGYELVKVRTELTIMEQSSENLRLDISMLKSPQRIQQIATNSLGMIIPPNVYMSSSKPAKAKTGDETKEVVRGSSNPLAFLWLGKAEAHSSR